MKPLQVVGMEFILWLVRGKSYNPGTPNDLHEALYEINTNERLQ